MTGQTKGKLRIGVICPSEIAYRRFMPSLQKCDEFVFVGVATANKAEWYGDVSDDAISADKAKAEKFVAQYSGKLYGSYMELIDNPDIDCVYIPLPPALHFEWAKEALLHGKHVLLEKPFTTELNDTRELIALAQNGGLALHENYMFQYHSQIDWIRNKLSEIGEPRLIRLDFGFPFRGGNDFRYNKDLGGGALLDCGGYTLKLASLLLGDTAKIVDATLGYKDGFDVDIYGSAVLRNADGLTAQISFGMDNSYRCSLDAWGSKATLRTNRVFTAPDGLEPTVNIDAADGTREYLLEADDCFAKSIRQFLLCTKNSEMRMANYRAILQQAVLVGKFLEVCP